MNLSPEEVRHHIDHLKTKIDHDEGDEEQWHCAEDGLVQAVLHAIADGVPDPQALAIEAIKLYDLNYARWYA